MSTPRQQTVPSPAAPQPGEIDYQCQQKLHELASTYMEPLKRWIQMKENLLSAGTNSDGKMMGGEEDQKEQKELKKMKSLLDILANKLPPKIPVNLGLLQKCEAVLQKILNHAQNQSNQPKQSFPTITRPPSVPLKVSFVKVVVYASLSFSIFPLAPLALLAMNVSTSVYLLNFFTILK